MQATDDQELDILLNLLDTEGDAVAPKQQDLKLTQLNENKKIQNRTAVYKELTREDDFLKSFDEPLKEPLKELHKNSCIHSGDTDSSDDEDNKYYHEQSYSEYGKNIKHLLANKPSTQESPKSQFCHDKSSSWKSKSNVTQELNLTIPKTVPKPQTNDLYAEPVSGVRVVNPLVTSAFLNEKLIGRQSIALSNIKKVIEQGKLSDDWLTIGVIVSSSPVKTSQKGSKYIIWRMSDLKGDLKTISLFLFSNAYKAFWKTASGVVVGILNPSVMEKRDSKDEAVLSVDVAQKILIVGKSKDLGFCKSRKANGDKCAAFVNVNSCELCIYHAQQEYKKCSKRSELQSAGSSAYNDLRNKVLGKNEVFYGGRSFMAIPAKASKKLTLKDDARIKQLCGMTNAPSSSQSSTSGGVTSVLPPKMFQQRMTAAKNKEQLLYSRLATSNTTQPSMQQTQLSFTKQDETTIAVTASSANVQKKTSDAFSDPSPPKHILLPFHKTDKLDLHKNRKQLQKAKAIQMIHQKGPITKTDPNAVKKTNSTERIQSLKRKLGIEDEATNEQKKRAAALNAGGQLFKAKFEQLMAVKSRHTDLLEAADQEAQDKYFDNLEKKEKIEEKLLSTYKLDCKAVKCLKCKYTAFSSSELCKREGHPIRVVDAVKRFFKCHDCNNRTVSLELIPLTSCKQCGSSHWERAPMIREKKTIKQNLSICGNNEKQGGFNPEYNLNLLVPE